MSTNERDELAGVIANYLGRIFGNRDFGPACQDFSLADALTKAGYGKLAEARAAELEAAADGWRAHIRALDWGTTAPIHWLRARAAAIRDGEA